MAIITRLGLYGGPRAPYPGFVAAAASAVVSGTAITGGVLESEVVSGGETIIITLANDTWVATGATFNAQRQNIIDGLDSAGVEAAGWNAEVRDKEAVTAVARTSDTVVTITLTASASYAIDADETITVTVPATALTAAGELVATPTFDVTAEAVAQQGGGWLSADQVAKLRNIARDNEQDRTNESRRRKQRREKRLSELEDIFNEIHGVIPEPAIEAVAEAVRPFATSSDAILPPVQAIDFTSLLASVDAVQALSAALLEVSEFKQEEDALILLMLAA